LQLSKIAINDGIVMDDNALTFIAKKADGALRDAQSLFDQVISFGGKNIDSAIVSQMLNLIDDDVYFNFSDAILSKDFIQAFEISKIVYDNGWNYIDFTNGLIEHFRNILTTVLKKDTSFVETSEEFKKKYLNYIKSFSESDLLRILLYLSKVEKEIKISQNQKLYMELALSHLIGIESSSTITEILNNLPKDLINTTKSFEIQKDKIEISNDLSKIAEIPITSEKNEETTINNITNIDDNLSNDENSLINAIINELGGREFK